MKFYLKILVIFGLFLAGAAALPHASGWVRKRDLEGRAKEQILASVKDPATVKWNGKRVTPKGGTTVLAFDVTADKIEGGITREVWTFEFESQTKDLLNVKQESGPRVQFNELAPAR